MKIAGDLVGMRSNVAIKKSKLHTLYEQFGSHERSVVDMFDALKGITGYGMNILYAHLNFLVDRGYATCQEKYHSDGRAGKARYYKIIVPEEEWAI